MNKTKENLNVLIVDFLALNAHSSSKKIHDEIAIKVGYATVKRALNYLLDKNFIAFTGNGKSTKYEISTSYAVLKDINAENYFLTETDKRKIINQFNHSLINETLCKVSIFTNEELNKLNELQKKFQDNISKLSKKEYKKELELLAIDLSWKSAQIEGNTYSLLETEILLKEKLTAAGKTKDEAVMLLNHKDALDFIIEHPSYVKKLSIATIEDIHSILAKELGIDRNIRKRKVGISGTNYKPLDNEFQIREALNDLCELVNNQKNVFAKALLVLILISYIQPFADGNKRTARIICNAILMNHKHCPMSFRTVDPLDYKKAMLIFYEQNNLSACKKIFIEQFEFAVNTYF